MGIRLGNAGRLACSQPSSSGCRRGRAWREGAEAWRTGVGLRKRAKMRHALRLWVTIWLRRVGFRYMPDGQRCMEVYDQDLPLWLLYGVWPRCVNSSKNA